MNDLDLLRSFQADLEPADSSPPAAIRRRLVLEVAGTRSKSARARRWMVPAGASVAAAALLIAVAAHGPSGDSGPRMVTGPVTAQNSRAVGEVDLRLDAGTILMAAATTARKQRETVPDASAFVYNRSKETGFNYLNGRVERRYSGEREAWLSVDGTRVGAVTTSDDFELGLVTSNCTKRGSADCNITEGYVAHAPSTRDAMVKHLKQGAMTDPVQVPGLVMQNAQHLLSERLAPAAVRAAVFEALATLPDVTVVTGATNALGQSGTSISVVDSYEHMRREVIFDRGHQMIGIRNVTLTDMYGLPAGSVAFSQARITQAVVPTLGLRPDGTKRKVPSNHVWNRLIERITG